MGVSDFYNAGDSVGAPCGCGILTKSGPVDNIPRAVHIEKARPALIE